jgi:hypothetical protein
MNMQLLCSANMYELCTIYLPLLLSLSVHFPFCVKFALKVEIFKSFCKILMCQVDTVKVLDFCFQSQGEKCKQVKRFKS